LMARMRRSSSRRALLLDDCLRAVGQVSAAIPRALSLDPMALHRRVRSMYSWEDVAKRTSAVYDAAVVAAAVDASDSTSSGASSARLLARLRRYRSAGPLFGLLGCAVAALLVCVIEVLDLLDPRASIEPAPEWWRAAAAAGGDSDGDDDGDDARSDSDSGQREGEIEPLW